MDEDALLQLMIAKKCGIITEKDNQLLEQAMSFDPAVRVLYEQVEKLDTPDYSAESTEQAWQSIQTRYNTVRARRRRQLLRRFAIAAVVGGILVVVSARVYYSGSFHRTAGPSGAVILQLESGQSYLLSGPAQKIEVNGATFTADSSTLMLPRYVLPSAETHKITISPGHFYKIVLSDSSVVTLSGGSTFFFPGGFSDTRRIVKLTGNGFFNVSKKDSSPFVLDANGMTVTVTGTTFAIDANPAYASVSLIEGAVQVTCGENQVGLRPGQQATLLSGGDVPTISSFNIDSLLNLHRDFGCYWFEDASLADLCQLTEKMYGYRVAVHSSRLFEAKATTGRMCRSDDPAFLYRVMPGLDIPWFVTVQDSTIHLYEK